MSVAAVIAKFLTTTTLGKTLKAGQVTAGLVDVVPSTDANNIIGVGSDGGLFAVPAKLALLKSEFFTATSLAANGGGWTKDARARWIVVMVIGGGGSGGYSGGGAAQGQSGGEPGAVEVLSGWATAFPATSDVTVGAGGTGTTVNATSNDGSPSSFGTLLQANGGRGGANTSRVVSGGQQRVLPYCSLRLGAPGTDAPGLLGNAEETAFGPGAGGGTAYGGSSGAGGAASVSRPASRTAGGLKPTASTSPPGAGNPAVANDPFSFGSGGAGSISAWSIAGGAGGAPGGGGGSGWYNSGNSAIGAYSGSGARGEIRVLTYG